MLEHIADFLVNSFEAHLAPESIITFRDHVFRSKSAIRMLNDMWGDRKSTRLNSSH